MIINTFSKSTARTRFALGAAVCVIAAGAAYNWLIQPHIQSLQALDRVKTRTESLSKKSKTLENLTRAKEITCTKLTEQVSEVQRQFFSRENAQLFFTNMDTLASQSACKITSLKLLPAAETENHDAVSGLDQERAAVSVAGTYASVIKFLTAILSLPQKITIDNVMMSARQDNPDRVECSLAVGIYVLKQGDSNDVR
jgi:Tfp pilus assembly protein PilO